MKNPTGWIWLSCCISILFPIGLGLGAYWFQIALAKRRPKLEYTKSSDKNMTIRNWRLEVYEKDPMAKEVMDD